ncbi:MAG TPA: hypothetical protein VN642_17985 [Dongiaceae bacterium]|nr:hypothetical protein [Dongiaceae bacterium]
MEFKHLYRTKIEKSFDEDQSKILETFKGLFKLGKTEIMLLNYYQGVPLSLPARIVSVYRTFMRLDVHPQQAVAFEKDRHTFIRCGAFQHDICADIHHIDVFERNATLGNFFFAEILADRRNAIRLVLDSPTEASFDVEGVKVSGSLMDISIEAAAIKVLQLPGFDKGFITRLQLKLPNNIQNSCVTTHVVARLVATKELDDGFLCIFSIKQGNGPDQPLSKFIFRRQVELIRALKDHSI